MNHRPRKRFGQNFLRDETVIANIIEAVNPQPGENIVEIGPGQGALTRYLLKRSGELTVIEIDRDLVTLLEANCQQLGKLNVIQRDVLKLDWQEVEKPTTKMRLVGNLPYNISTPLFFHCFTAIERIEDMCFMVQREVADRLTAKPNNKQYGRLSVMAQYFCHAVKLFEVPPEAFYPAPKVVSAVVRMLPRQRVVNAEDFSHFEEVVRIAFNQRRKTLTNSLRGLVTTEQLQALGIDPKARAENLTVEEFILIANSR